MSVKGSLQQWGLPLTTNISLNGCEWKKYVENACSRCFWQKMKSWWGKDADQNISATRSLTLLIFVVGVSIEWSTTTRTRISDATAVTLSVKCCNSLKLCQETSTESGLLHTFFICSRALNFYWSPASGKSYCCNGSYANVLLMSWLYRC